MQVFKTCFKIIRSNIPSMAIYMGIFLGFVILLTQFVGTGTATSFEPSRIRMAIIQDDADHPLSRGLQDFLSQRSVITALPDDDEALQDALFFRHVDYILRIPAGFGQSLADGTAAVSLIKSSVPESASSMQMDLLIKRYVKTAALYLHYAPGLSSADLISFVNADLSVEAVVDLAGDQVNDQYSRATYYFSYLAYTMMAVMILGVSSIMISFNNRDLSRRNNSSPIRLLNFNLQIVLGNLIFMIAAWALMIGISFIFGSDGYQGLARLLLALNALAFATACLGISFLIGNLIKGRNAQQAVANVVSLGTCFISGVFVPQELLGDTVKNIASFTPTYWYVRNVIELNQTVDLPRYLTQVLIQLGFAAAAFLVALAAARQKRTAAN